MTDPGSVADLEHTPYESVSAVSFHTDRKGNVSGRFRGAVVLRDRSSEEIIRPGETWFCSLRLNPISLGNYFARAIRKVDASFFMELGEGQKKEIAEALWENSRSEIVPLIMESHAVDRDVYEKTSEGYERRIKELTDRLEASVPVTTGVDVPDDAGPTITDTPQGLFSSLFRTGRYAVRLSADGKNLLLTPDERGEAECRGNILMGHRLRDMMPFCGRPSIPCKIYGDGVLVQR